MEIEKFFKKNITQITAKAFEVNGDYRHSFFIAKFFLKYGYKKTFGEILLKNTKRKTVFFLDSSNRVQTLIKELPADPDLEKFVALLKSY